MLSVPGPVTVVRLGQAGNVIEKDSGLIPQVLSAILDEHVNGIALADPDLEDAPIVYAHKAFERLKVIQSGGNHRSQLPLPARR
jgi:hypothetical protein